MRPLLRRLLFSCPKTGTQVWQTLLLRHCLLVPFRREQKQTTTTKHGKFLVLEQTGNQQDAFVPDLFGKLTGSF